MVWPGIIAQPIQIEQESIRRLAGFKRLATEWVRISLNDEDSLAADAA
jgi:hypothetical protein